MENNDTYENPYAIQLFSDLSTEVVKALESLKKDVREVCEKNQRQFLVEEFQEALAEATASAKKMRSWAVSNNDLNYLPTANDCDHAIVLAENCVQLSESAHSKYNSVAYHTKLFDRNFNESKRIFSFITTQKKIEKNLRYLKAKLSPEETGK